MKVIFLDIDGVLNPKWWERKKHVDIYGCAFDQKAVANLAMIIEKTGAEIVISSSWKCLGLSQLHQMWKDRKLPGKVIYITPDAVSDEVNQGLTMNDYWSWRGLEIKEWLSRHKGEVSNYVIIDDNGGMLEEQQNLFVQTDPNVGISDFDAKIAVMLLNN